MLVHNIREIELAQIRCGPGKLEWTRVLNIILRLFADTDFRVNILLPKVKWNSNFDNALLAEEYSNDEETCKNVFHKATAQKLALEGVLQTPPNVDRDLEFRAFHPERRFQSLPPIEISH